MTRGRFASDHSVSPLLNVYTTQFDPRVQGLPLGRFFFVQRRTPMLSLLTTASMQLVADVYSDPALRSLLAMRMAQLASGDVVNLGNAAHFLIFEPGLR
jgi:hypothetical protein